MRASVILLAVFSVVAMSKNIAKLEDFRIAIEKELENDKRDAKNVFKLADLQGVEEGNKVKRDAKNVFNLKSLQELENKGKRDAKNVFNLNALKELHIKSKREAKNVFRIEDFKDVDFKEKRAQEHQVTFSIAPEDSHDNLLQSELPKIQEITIFNSYLRESKDIFEKTDDENEIMVIVAPSNEALTKGLNGLKPWEFPEPLGSDEEKNDKIAESNIKYFVKHHVILNFDDHMEFGDGNTVTSTLESGNKIRIKQNLDTDNYQISVDSNDWIDVASVAQVANGFVFVVNSCLVTP